MEEQKTRRGTDDIVTRINKPKKLDAEDFGNVTQISTPPQATSTVARKATRYSAPIDQFFPRNLYNKNNDSNDLDLNRNESSLGIISNISSLLDSEDEKLSPAQLEKSNSEKPTWDLDEQLMLARQLIERASTKDLPKETNTSAKVQSAAKNLECTSDNTSLTLLASKNHSPTTDKSRKSESSLLNLSNKFGLVFEPEEISARSSGLSKLSEKLLSSEVNQLLSNSKLTDAMNCPENEEFVSGDKLLNQLSSDEKNFPYLSPSVTQNQSDRMNTSNFSTMSNSFNVPNESGSNMSIQEFFIKRSPAINAALGESLLSTTSEQRSTFPERTGPFSEGTSLVDGKDFSALSETTDMTKNYSVMSLTTLAQALKESDTNSPRQLVNHIVNVEKQKKHQKLSVDGKVGVTYNVAPPTRLSTAESLSSTVQTANSPKASIAPLSSFKSIIGMNPDELSKKLSEPNEKVMADVTKQSQSTKSTLTAEQNMSNLEELKRISVASLKLQGQMQQMGSFKDIIIHQNTQETCIVGVTREVDFEISNNGDRWVKCDLKLYEIKDAHNNIQLEFPSSTVMLHSTSEKIIKIKVKVTEMGPPIIAEFSVYLKDYVTQERWSTKHFICFVPEELQVDFRNINNDCLDFGSLVENMSRSLEICVANGNSVELPLKLRLIQNNAMLYYLQGSILDINNTNEFKQTLTFTLGPQMLFEQVIDFKGTTVAALTGNENSDHKGKHCIAATLNIELNNETERGMIIKSIPINTVVSVCKVEVMETQIPLMIPQRRKVPFKVCNSGCVAVMVSATIVHSDAGSRKVNKDFSSEPDYIILNAGEKGAFQLSYTPDDAHASSENATMRITAGSNVHCHTLLGEQYPTLEQSSDSLTRCETPQCAMSYTSPTSRTLMSRSGRDSPGDSISGVTVAGDVIPIRSTHVSLVWSSVKAGKNDTKEFTIKNTSAHKIKVQATIHDNNNSFRFLKERQTLSSSTILALHSMESRTLSVVFGPNSTGAAAGKIVFKHYETRRSTTDGTGRPTKVIYLYGYGGIGKIDISEAFKDTSGQLWLSLGRLNSGGSLESKIKLENTGDLCSFAKIKLQPKTVRPDMVSSWRIEPTELLLGPHQTQWVTLEFKPKKEDLPALIHNDVSHVATLLITHGDEPTRWRIRRLFNKLKESGGLSGKDKEAFRAAVHPICKIFPGETMIEDLNSMRDTVDNIGDLCRGVRQDEVKLTIQTQGDDSTIFLSDSANESYMYQSLLNDKNYSRRMHFNNSYLPQSLPNETQATFYMESENFTVSPELVVLNPPNHCEATVLISASSPTPQAFETEVSASNIITINPSAGMIQPGNGSVIKIQCKRQPTNHMFEVNLNIYTKNDKRQVLVRIIPMKQF